MNPPIFQVCSADPAVTALLGTGPTRMFPKGRAPQGVTLPYAVFQRITGSPENYLGQAPDIDRHTIQVDVYGKTASQVEQVVKALRDAVEPHGHIVNWNGDGTDPDTGHKHDGFDVDWFVPR